MYFRAKHNRKADGEKEETWKGLIRSHIADSREKVVSNQRNKVMVLFDRPHGIWEEQIYQNTACNDLKLVPDEEQILGEEKPVGQ